MNNTAPIHKILLGVLVSEVEGDAHEFFIVRYYSHDAKMMICVKMNHVPTDKSNNDIIMLSFDNVESSFSGSYSRLTHDRE